MIKKGKVKEDKLVTNGIQLSTVSLVFMGLMLVASSFMAGYFFKSASGGANQAVVPTTPDPQAQQQPAKPQVAIETIKGLFSKNLIKFGDANKKLLLVDISDPSCPYCHVAGGANKGIGKQIGPQFTLVSDGGTYVPPVPEMKKLVDSGKAGYVWIYSPGHGAGEMATKAFYCAYEAGKFWPVHEKLMNDDAYTYINNTLKNDKTKSADLAKYLAGVANENEMRKCLESGKYDGRIAEDTAQATALGVQGTPGFFVNSTNFAGAYSWTDMKAVADAALK